MEPLMDQTPGMTSATGTQEDYRLIAMYDSAAQAREARDLLVREGIPESSIQLINEDGPTVTGETDDGIWGAIRRFFMPDEEAHAYAEGLRRGEVMVVVQPGPAFYDRAMDVLERTGAVDFDAQTSEWRSAGWDGRYAGAGAMTDLAATDTLAAGPATTAPRLTPETSTTARTTAASTATRTATAGATASVRAGEQERIPLVEEQLRVGKRQVGRGSVRVRSYVVERPVQEQVTLREEQVQVERRPVDRPVTAGEEAFRERTIEVAATGEEAVVQKDTRVREELVVSKNATERTETVKDTVRRTEVDVEDGRAGTGLTRNKGKGQTRP